MKERLRKLVAIIMTVFMILVICTGKSDCGLLNSYAEEGISNVTAEDGKVVGDIDCDGKIDINDASKILKFYSEESAGIETDNIDMFTYDVNKDDKVNITDASLILEFYSCLASGKNPVWPPVAESQLTTGTSETSTVTTELTTSTVPETTLSITNTTTNSATTTTVTTLNENAANAFSSGQYLMFNGTSWNIRNKMNEKDDSIVEKLHNGDYVEVLNNEGNGWYIVKNIATNQIAYMLVKVVSYFDVVDSPNTTEITTTTTEKLTTTTTTLSDVETMYKMGDVVKFTGSYWNIRSDVGGQAVDTISTDETFVIIQHVQEQWYRVSVHGTCLYINMESPWVFTKTGELSNENQITSIQQVSVGDILKYTYISWAVNDTDGNLIGYVYQDELIAIIGKSGDIYEVVTNSGLAGYLYCNSIETYFVEMV